MDKFIIEGGRSLSGSVRISGSKNAALPMMAAALLGSDIVELHDVPRLADVDTLAALLDTLGMTVTRDAARVQLTCRDTRPVAAGHELVGRMRAGVCVLGPLLARRGRARVSLPGGCHIGQRPIDLHLRGLAALGADVSVQHGYVQARAGRLQGARILLAGPQGSTVTGTCNVMSAATLARGVTVIDCAAQEPEVVALADLLNAMGARVAGAGSSQIVIDGVRELGGARATIIPDRIEAATLAIAAGVTRSEIVLSNVRSAHLHSVTEALRSIGLTLAFTDDRCVVSGRSDLAPYDAVAWPYPGLPTDVQAQMTALLTTIPGVSTVRDAVFPERFRHLDELARLGAQVRRQGDTAVIRGGAPLTGAPVRASDLRASAALVLGALAAEGRSEILRIHHLDRGYERLEEKLTALGGVVARVADDQLEAAREQRRSA